MYSDQIIQRSIEKIEAGQSATLGRPFRLIRFPDDIALEMIERLSSIRDADGKFSRDLTRTELAFIENELTMCAIDFRYWASRYAYILSASKDGGTVRFRPAGSQELVLEKIAQLEVAMWDAYAEGKPVDGICVILHKARQLGATALSQILLAHRTFFMPGFRGLTASMDDQATQAVHGRFTRIYDRLPWWMQPATTFRTKERGMRFGRLDSVMELQDAKQTKGLGQGETWDGGHLTECASWPDPGTIEHDFFPTVPYSVRALVLLESTAQGRKGWWYDFTEQVRSGSAEGGSGRFTYTFVPYYAIDQWEQSNNTQLADENDNTGLFSKYRRNPPPGWEPNEQTRGHAALVEATSPEWMNGRTVRLDREVLYFWETTRAQYYRQGRLDSFLTNFCATPEESFQHSGDGAFDNATIERVMEDAHRESPLVYELMTEDQAQECATYSDLPVHRIPIGETGNILCIGPVAPHEIDLKDPRGLILIWEQPELSGRYYCSSDPCGGIPGWSRVLKQQDDIKIDNGTVEVYRKEPGARMCETCSGTGWIKSPNTTANITIECEKCRARGRIGGRAVQVCEFAAPVDAEDLAKWVYAISTLYRGASDSDQCLTIVENNNTGIMTIRKLQNEFQHSSLYRWRTIDGEVPKFTNALGWHSSSTTVPVLHARSKGAITRRDVLVRSKYLAQELNNAVVVIYADGQRRRFEVPAGAGRHDDRMSATFMALWALFDWTESQDDADAVSSTRELTGSVVNFAASDCTAEEMRDRWNETLEARLGDDYGSFDLDDDKDEYEYVY